MARLQTYAPVLLLTLLLGCSDSPVATPEEIQHVEDTKAQMIGMSLEETFTCLGLPAKRTHAGDVETLSYTFGPCIVDLTVAPDDQVKSVSYNILPFTKALDEMPPLEQQCAKVPEVASCTRWLRK